ncbi:MAG: glutamine--tRNA ligase/YqeY domain fusion protein [Bacillota bacterium]|nr:glutamine--tRNA ligase/YqeY domain fusion protein [Bacillota bacterium]
MVDLGTNFIYDEIEKDLKEGTYTRVQTRFPPEPNGYLHIGHAKAISIDFAAAEKYGGKCNLRLDDTNPTKEDVEYVDAIQEDIEWLGFKWDNVYYASDYFDIIYKCAIELIKQGKAYVCDLNADQIREYRGTLTEPGKESPYRGRSVEENMDLFSRMTAGEFQEGEKVLRAKIDMASPNLNMRDPIIYRILKAHHHRTGDKWCVYPMYDFAHPISDTAEKVTHSLCSLEFENHRPLYDWVLREVGIFDEPSRQIEFARLNLNYTLTSKRKCLKLVNDAVVSGWDDPRMSTLCGMRRRGFPPEAILDFISRIGVSKANSVVDFALLEHCVRDYLNAKAPRAMAVLRPLKVIIDNYPAGQTEEIMVQTSPNDPEIKAPVTFSRELYIESEDFEEVPPNKFFRLAPGKEVRLRGTYFITCVDVDKDENGKVTAVHCTYDPETKGGNAPDGRKVKGTIHWVSCNHSVDAEIRLYERLFDVENPSDEENVGDFIKNLNPGSLEIIQCKIEASLANAKQGDKFQFVRTGYFCADKESTPDKLVFNRIVSLKDSYKV